MSLPRFTLLNITKRLSFILGVPNLIKSDELNLIREKGERLLWKVCRKSKRRLNAQDAQTI